MSPNRKKANTVISQIKETLFQFISEVYIRFQQMSLKAKLIVIAIFLVLLPQLSFLAFQKTVPVINRVIGMPDLNILEDYRPIGSIEVYDYDDNFVGVLQGKEDRQVVKLDDISDYVKQAVLAIEDTNFYHHSGVSFIGLIRATLTNLVAGRIVQGGSTITQQMVKNLFIKQDERYKRSFLRKIRELFIAVEVEQRYDKDKILEIYLNQVYFGNRAYGIERAAQRYFSKSASQLNLNESSYLAGLLTAPTYLSENLEEAQKRQNKVLNRMKKNGYITKQEYKEVKESKLAFKKSQGNFSKFPYYFSYIEEQLKKRYTRNELRQMGLKVYTGLDPVAQQVAKRVLQLGVKNAAYGINQGAMVVLDVETSEIRALVGGVGDFWKYQYNRATHVHALGSAIKPFIYLTAFMQGVIAPDSIIQDEPFEVEDISAEDKVWAPKNFDEEFHGPITAKAALIFSRNIPAIKVAMRAGLKNVVKTAKLAGIKSNLEPLLSLALGAQGFTPVEVASAYSTLARGGAQIDPILIRKIEDSTGRVLEINRPIPKQALPEKDVAVIVDIMQDVVNYGTGALAKIPGRTIAGKTGTADGGRDIWFSAFTPDFVATVWAGNEKNREVLSRYATGGGTPAWVWKEFATNYYKLKPRPPKPFSFTKNYTTVLIDPLTGLLATKYTPNPVKKRFIPGTEPTRFAPTPDADKIEKRRERKDGIPFLGRKRLSEEDRKIRKIREYEKEEEELEKEELQFEDRAPTVPKIMPKPKFVKIETH